MAKKKERIWSEDELILTFGLERTDNSFPLLAEWLSVEEPHLVEYERSFFEQMLLLAKKGADFWNEETLKMRFISPLLSVLVRLEDEKIAIKVFITRKFLRLFRIFICKQKAIL
jgi:hypothetical protein